MQAWERNGNMSSTHVPYRVAATTALARTGSPIDREVRWALVLLLARRWYTATVDSAFGIPPDDASVDVFGGRAASHVPNASEPGRAPTGAAAHGEKIGAVSRTDARERRQ